MHENAINFENIFIRFLDFPPHLLMTSAQENLRNNKSIESGLKDRSTDFSERGEQKMKNISVPSKILNITYSVNEHNSGYGVCEKKCVFDFKK